MHDAKVVKERYCKKCYLVFVTTAFGIKVHAANCNGERDESN